MFDHPTFDVYAFDDVPVDEQQCFLISEEYIEEYERAFLDLFHGAPYRNVGYASGVAVRRVNPASIDMDWTANQITRFHVVSISLPRDEFVACVGCWRYDEDPHIFVRKAWLETLLLRFYSVFCLVDADNFLDALRDGRVTRDKLLLLRTAIDKLAADHQGVLFISFADSLLLKSNWTVGHFRSDVKYTYRPEDFLRIFQRIQKAYADILVLKVHAVLTQGSNEYYEEQLSDTSESGNHVCLNSLGIPFAQLQDISAQVKKNLRSEKHARTELYMDEAFYHSLALKSEFKRERQEKYPYDSKMVSNAHYYCGRCQDLLDNVEEVRDLH